MPSDESTADLPHSGSQNLEGMELADPSQPQEGQRIILVQCVSKKRTVETTAENLYTSELFERQRAYATAFGDEWYILSAKHGVVHPDETLSPYDVDISKVNSEVWGEDVAKELLTAIGVGRMDTVEILAGEKYADPLTPELEREGIEVHEPLRGMRLHPRKEWLKHKVATVENHSLGAFP